MSLIDKLKQKKILVSDGAWGTFLFQQGLQVGDCPEEWNLIHPNKVRKIAQSYIDAGSDIISTNSFGASRLKLKQYGLEAKAFLINKTAAAISRQAAGDKLVFGSIGPTGKFLITGEVTEEELSNSFKEQTLALAEGGADAILLETFYDLDEALIAARSVKESSHLPVACTFTFDKQPDDSYKTVMGITPETFVSAMIEVKVDIIGSNCGLGFRNITDIAKVLKNADSNIPLLIQANAGLPQSVNNELLYSETPEFIVPFVQQLIESGVSIIGGCCGTTPEHIKTIREIVDVYNG